MHRKVQQEVFQVHAAATVDVEAVEAQLRGEVTYWWNHVGCSSGYLKNVEVCLRGDD